MLGDELKNKERLKLESLFKVVFKLNEAKLNINFLSVMRTFNQVIYQPANKKSIVK